MLSLQSTAALALTIAAAVSPVTSARYTNTFSPTNYTVVPGVFIQDSATFNATGYDYTVDSLGLIDKSANRWTNFTSYVDDLNAKADSLTAYKVIYIARHGEGYHNVAQTLYGTPAWNCYWSLLTTDGNITWGPDAVLTANGVESSVEANAFFKEQVKDHFPLPQVLYSSPFRRAASTLNITWSDILLDKPGYAPLIKESLRESIGLHTCDQRSNKSVIAKDYPGFVFADKSFSEQDELWNSEFEESSTQQALRLQQFMNELFANDDRTYISITAHSGVINAFFVAIGHRAFSVATGGIVPVLVKAVGNIHATQALITGGQSGTAPACTANPTTAVASPATATSIPVIVTPAPTTTASA